MGFMDFKLELVILPVSDIDRAKEYYADRLGFNVDVDHAAGDFRIVQLTPPGSACSVTLMRNGSTPGSIQGLHLVVTDIDAARDELLSRGAEPSEIFHFGETGETPGHDPERRDYGSYFSLSDPDGNSFLVQEVPSRR